MQALVFVAPSSNPVLAPQRPIQIPKIPGAFDHMLVDAPEHRLLIAHTSSKALAIVDVRSGTVVRSIYLGGSPHGIAMDESRGIYFVGTSGEAQVVELDRRSLAVLKTIRMPGPVDALAFDSKRQRLYADEDNGQSIWVLDRSAHVIATIKTPQDSDKVQYDPTTDRLYQNFTSIDATLVIDPATNLIVAHWSTLPARRPHGLAVDLQRHELYVAGANGWLVALDLSSGRLLASLPLARNVDQVALDSGRRRLYCASGDGFVSVIDVAGARPRLLANVSVPAGAHTLAADPNSGDVWIAYGTPRDDFIMRLAPR